MNPAAASPGPVYQSRGVQPWLRVSDHERESVTKLLQDAYADGRLDDKELDLRVDQALGARTYAELHVPLRDLVSYVATPQPRPRPPRAPASESAGERIAAMVMHWSGYVTLFVAPLIVYLVEGRRNSYLKHQAAQAANFQLTFLLANLVLGLTSVFVLPALLFPVLWVGWLVLVLTGGIASATGSSFRYPLTLQIFR